MSTHLYERCLHLFGGWGHGSQQAQGPKCNPQKQYKKLDAVVRTCNPSPREAETGGAKTHRSASPANLGSARPVGDSVSKHNLGIL